MVPRWLLRWFRVKCLKCFLDVPQRNATSPWTRVRLVLLKMKLQQCNLKRSQISHHCHRMKWKKIQGKYKMKILTPPPPGSKVNPTSDVMQRRLKHLTNSRRGEKKTKVTLIINNSSGWKQNVKKKLWHNGWFFFFLPNVKIFCDNSFSFSPLSKRNRGWEGSRWNEMRRKSVYRTISRNYKVSTQALQEIPIYLIFDNWFTMWK